MSEKLIRNVLRGVQWTLLGISVLFTVIFAIQISGAEGMAAEMEATNPILVWTYILLALGACVAVIFPVIYIAQNPRKAIKVFVALAALAVVILISYLASDATPISAQSASANPDFSNRAVLLMSDTGIIATYILLGVSVLLLVATGLRSLISNR